MISELCSDFSNDLHEHFKTFNRNESFSVDSNSWKSFQILYKMFSDIKRPFAFSFALHESCSMKLHHFKNFSKSWHILTIYKSSWTFISVMIVSISVFEKTPRIPKTSSSDHKTIEIIYFSHSIFIIHDISVTNQRNIDMIFEFVDLCKISVSRISLCSRSSVNSETCSPS